MDKLFKKVVPVVSGLAILAAPTVSFAESEASRSGTIGTGYKRQQAKYNDPRIHTENIHLAGAEQAVKNNVSVPSATEDIFAQYAGKPIGAVAIAGVKSADKTAIYNAISIGVGQTLTFNAVQNDLKNLYALGCFKEVVPSFHYIGSPDGSATGEGMSIEVVYHFKEYPAIKDIDVQGASLTNKFHLAKLLDLKQGVPANINDIREKLTKLEEEYKNNGFVLARVVSANITDDGVLHILINEGKIKQNIIKGNTRTKEYVIRRELRQKEGDVFNTEITKRSVQRLHNLGFFDDIDVQMQPNDDGTVNVIFEIEEGNTATIGIGAGYSQSNGVTGQLTLEDKNLLGTGDSASMTWEFGGRDNANYNVSYVKPWLDKKETSMSINIYRGTQERTDYNRDGYETANYDKRSTGQEITFSRAEGEFVRNYITLKHRNDTYRRPVGGGAQYYEDDYPGETYGKTTEERRRENFGETRAISLMRVYDSRDSIFDAHHGKRMAYTFEFAGFGGDFNYQKISADHRYYWELNPKTKHVLALDLAAGYAWGNMPLSQRFSMGGSNTLRGYRDDQFRGNSMLRASLEYRVPLAKKVSAVAFVDTGYAWDKRDEKQFDLHKIKTGYGVGLRFFTPIGPVRLDYGIGDHNRFHFAFGTSF